MKLYFSPGACCMSCHIALIETNTPFELVYVGKNADEVVKKDFKLINPLGMVPALELDNNKVLTQNTAILEYIADQHPEAGLLEKVGTVQRAETMLWLSLVAADLHKAFHPLFGLARISSDPNAQSDIKNWSFSNIDKYLSIIEQQLQDHQYIAGDHFTIADCYLYTVYQWTKIVKFPTDKYTALNSYSARLGDRPSIKYVHEQENKYR
jgi:glutathione S-transferase